MIDLNEGDGACKHGTLRGICLPQIKLLKSWAGQMAGPLARCCFAVLIVASTSGTVGGQQTVGLRERIDEHTQARALANELVSTIFDVQLRHLVANGLAELPIYSEILASRDKIDLLASTEMEQLSQLLQQLQSEDVDRRDELLAAARITARQIAVAMMAERQRLRGRLRTSRIILLVRQMIAVQQQAIVATLELKSQSDSVQPRLAEQIAQSQLDLAVLFDQLTTMLQNAKETVGQDRISAAAALDHLKAEQSKVRIAEAAASLKSGSYEAARQSEQHILDSLEEVQRLMQQGEQLEEEARRQALEAIARTVKEQQELRRRTQSQELLDAKQRDNLAAEQLRIAEQLEQLREPLRQLAPVDEQMLAASDAAEQAAKHVGAGEQEQALERQETVLNMLDEIAQHLNAEALDPDSLADRAAQLEQLSTSLNELVEQQAEASELAASDPTSAAEMEAAIADSLEEADDASRLSDDVEARLDEAQEAVKQAQQALEDDASGQSRLAAVESAEKSLLEAAAEVQSQLADMQQAMEAANPTEANPSSDSTSKNEASSGTTRDAGSNSISEQASDIESRSFDQEAWFARLPADLQNRIRAATRRPPPRGYETRLQRYFQSRD